MMFSDKLLIEIIKSLGQAGFACALIYLIVFLFVKYKLIGKMNALLQFSIIIFSFIIIAFLSIYTRVGVEPPPLGRFTCQAADRPLKDCIIARGLLDTYELSFASSDSSGSNYLDTYIGAVTPGSNGYLVTLINSFQPAPGSTKVALVDVSELRLGPFIKGTASGQWTFRSGDKLLFKMQEESKE